jgi:hypothetical protein
MLLLHWYLRSVNLVRHTMLMLRIGNINIGIGGLIVGRLLLLLLLLLLMLLLASGVWRHRRWRWCRL